MARLQVAARIVSRLVLLAMLLGAGVVTAEAAGTITGLGLPSNGTAGKPFPVTIQGSGTCGKITVDWHTQDGQPPEPLDNKSLPLTYPHTYASAGTYNLVVKAASADCQGGTKTATVKVVAPPPPGPTSLRSLGPLAAQSAGHAGAVRGVATNPSGEARPNQPVVATVTGYGPSALVAAQIGQPCEVFVDWGDGDPRTPLKGAFPMTTPPHRYPNTRVQGYTITAEGRGSCEGKVTTLLKVLTPGQAEGRSTKELAVVSESVTPPPVIKTVIPKTPNQDLGCGVSGINAPGARLLLVGTNFGTRKGQATLAGSFSGGAPALESLSWTDTEIEGTIPAIRGAFDQKARLQVTRPAGKSSNQYEIAFTAARERVKLPAQAMTVVACSTAATENGCIAGSHPSASTFGSSFYGTHNNTGFETSDKGSDTYALRHPLKNGWLFESWAWASPPKGIDGGPLVSRTCAPDVRISVNWFVESGGLSGRIYASYSANVFAVGPAGVPYQ